MESLIVVVGTLFGYVALAVAILMLVALMLPKPGESFKLPSFALLGNQTGAIDPIPNMGRFKQAGGGFIKGAGAGVISGLAMAFLGAPLGQAGGAILAGAIYGGTDGRTVAMVGGTQAVEMLFVGDAA